MKRCPKCSRTYPDDNQKFCTVDGGLLMAAEQGFDPNATIQIFTPPPATPPSQQPPELPRHSANLGETIALSPPTADLPRTTGPLSPPSVPGSRLPGVTTALPKLPDPTPVGGPVAPPEKKSKLPLILGVLLTVLVLGVGAVAALFFLVIKPRLDQVESPPVVTRANQNENVNQNVNTNTAEQPAPPTTEPELVPPPNSVKFANSKENLDGKLAEHYLDFSFYYPNTWEVDPKAGVPGASNFVRVERRLPPDFTQENFAVGWYRSKGTYATDLSDFPRKVAEFSAGLGNAYPGYRKVSEGPTKINSLDAYEFRWVGLSKGTEKGDLQLWGRVVFVPNGVAGDSNGATLSMFTTSLAPELTGVNDVGTRGEIPVILDSFRFAKAAGN